MEEMLAASNARDLDGAQVPIQDLSTRIPCSVRQDVLAVLREAQGTPLAFAPQPGQQLRRGVELVDTWAAPQFDRPALPQQRELRAVGRKRAFLDRASPSSGQEVPSSRPPRGFQRTA